MIYFPNPALHWMLFQIAWAQHRTKWGAWIDDNPAPWEYGMVRKFYRINKRMFR